MADVTGQIQRRPGVCVATLGPGADQHDAWRRERLPRSIAARRHHRDPRCDRPRRRHASGSRSECRVSAVYEAGDDAGRRGYRSEGQVRTRELRSRRAWAPCTWRCRATSLAREDRVTDRFSPGLARRGGVHEPDAIDRIVARLQTARRPIVILGLDLNPHTDAPAVREFVDRLGVPVFVTPKAKGMMPEDHPLFYGVCAGVAGDSVVLECSSGRTSSSASASSRWSPTSCGTDTIGWCRSAPCRSRTGSIGRTPRPSATWRSRSRLSARARWVRTRGRRRGSQQFREAAWMPCSARRRRSRGLSGYELTLRLRELMPRDTVLATDVGSR